MTGSACDSTTDTRSPFGSVFFATAGNGDGLASSGGGGCSLPGAEGAVIATGDGAGAAGADAGDRGRPQLQAPSANPARKANESRLPGFPITRCVTASSRRLARP